MGMHKCYVFGWFSAVLFRNEDSSYNQRQLGLVNNGQQLLKRWRHFLKYLNPCLGGHCVTCKSIHGYSTIIAASFQSSTFLSEFVSWIFGWFKYCVDLNELESSRSCKNSISSSSVALNSLQYIKVIKYFMCYEKKNPTWFYVFHWGRIKLIIFILPFDDSVDLCVRQKCFFRI